MRFTSFATAAAAFASAAQGLNILITNDDGYATSNIREFYKAVKAFGHNVWLVSSTTDMSGNGGRAVFTTESKLTIDAEFGVLKAGSPSFGQDPADSHIWYYNGTPATQVFIALDYVLPKFANFSIPDLVLSGPNFGLNPGPFFYTLSGTIGATYAAIERGIPAIAFSTGNTVQTPYFWTNSSTKAGLQDPATIAGRLCANLAQAFIDKAAGKRVLPLGYGINVNIPFITSQSNSSCVNPPFILTRFTGGATVDGAVFNNATGLFSFTNVISPGTNQCLNGDCSLPGETDVVNSGCKSAVSVFTVDYDAPSSSSCGNGTNPSSLVPSIVQRLNSTTLVGGLGSNASVAGTNGTATSSPTSSSTAKPTASTVPVNAAGAVTGSVTAAVLAVLAALVL